MDVRSRTGGRIVAAINIVPLIDVLLVLIILFMVISPLQPVGLTAAIPQPAVAPAAHPDNAVIVRVLSHDAVCINQESVSWSELGSRLESIFGRRAGRVAFVEGGDAVEFADVARAISVMRAAGVDKVGFVTGDLPSAR
jgi:biopolymer transport protein TolR